MSKCNNTLLDAPLVEEDIYGSITFFDLSIYLASVFTVVASCLSGYLIFRHATNYTKPGEQKQILRILFMIPIYSITATLSIKYYHAHVYLEATHLFYEALVLAAFFMLLCSYLAPTMEELREKLLLVKPKPWAPPLSWMPKKSRGEKGWFRTPRSGLTLFMIIWIFVFQYCIVKALLTFITFITEATETYCATSNSIKFAHIWVTQIQGQSLGFAMFCLLQLYLQFKSELEKHSPFLKFLAIKIVVFLTLFQSSAFTFLAAPEDAVLKPTAKISYISWNIAVPNLLLCFEMAAAALLHLWAYPWRQYAQTSAEISDNYATLRKQGGFKAVCDALNYWDFVKAIGSGFYWLRVERKSRDDYGAPEGGVDEITLKGKEIEDDL